jgi:hypothetical protein
LAVIGATLFVYNESFDREKNKRMRSCGYSFMVGISACLLAQIGLAQSGVKVVFVSPQQLDTASLLPNPPASDSAQATAEFAELHRIQDTRSPARIAPREGGRHRAGIFIFCLDDKHRLLKGTVVRSMPENRASYWIGTSIGTRFSAPTSPVRIFALTTMMWARRLPPLGTGYA